MNFLELVQRTRRECSATGSVPSTVVGQTGMNARLVDWVSDAWKKIQEEQEYWKFLHKEFEFELSTTAMDYPPYAPAGAHAGLQDWARWVPASLRLYTPGSSYADEQFLNFFHYEDFRNAYRMGARNTGRPMAFTIRPRDSAIMFDVQPDQVYVCAGEHYSKPVILTSNTDTPQVEERFHMLIVYEAMLSYGIDQSAVEVISRAQKGRNDLMPSFQRKYLPEFVA